MQSQRPRLAADLKAEDCGCGIGILERLRRRLDDMDGLSAQAVERKIPDE
jgi:hypothetical protein